MRAARVIAGLCVIAGSMSLVVAMLATIAAATSFWSFVYTRRPTAKPTRTVMSTQE